MIHNQSVFDKWPIESESVQSIITSPPYFNLRKYDIPDIRIGEWIGQYGLEPTSDCGQPFMRLKEDLTPKEKEYILDELRKHGAI